MSASVQMPTTMSRRAARSRIRATCRAAMERLDAVLDAPFGTTNNPLKNLGALGWMFYWVVVASGVYLFMFFDTGIVDAYASVEYITTEQWYLAGVMRSLHRYASDAMIVVMLVHILREWLSGQYRGARWFTWVSGVPLVAFLYASGITGYWLVWDQLAQYVAIGTTEWLDGLGIFGEPIARNFLNSSVLSSRFFSLMVFMHIAIPLVLLFAMWLHIQRITQPNMNPPRTLAAGTLASLIALSALFPAVSQGPANLDEVVATVGLDWFYLQLYPLLDVISAQRLWLLVVGLLACLAIVPFLSRWPRNRSGISNPSPAVVDLDNCNGCARCAQDCPFSAISMIARTDGKPYQQQAAVDTKLCTGCGLCAGSCPTSTPFRAGSALVAGIELPDEPLLTLRQNAIDSLNAIDAAPRIMVFGCHQGPDLSAVTGTAAVETLPCIGALPPSFIDFVLSRGHADGVMLVGCREGACFFRTGLTITQARIRRQRDPYLRQRVPRQRIAETWIGAAGTKNLTRAVASFAESLRRLDVIESEKKATDEETAA